MKASNRVVSLWDMLEINAANFITAVSELRLMKSVIQHKFDDSTKAQIVGALDRETFIQHAGVLQDALFPIGARLAIVSTDRLITALNDDQELIYIAVSNAIEEIESRLRDELGFTKMFVINADRASLFRGADYLLGQAAADAFPSAWFDCEEASKCLCLGRPTAAVFHCMRMLEISIKALAKRLNIADPVKPAEKNWGIMLGAIKGEIDNKFPVSTRMPGTEGHLLERIYSSLDAVKNPWRNATMHVEAVYTEAEAQHILHCTAIILQHISEGFDENGNDVQFPSLPGIA